MKKGIAMLAALVLALGLCATAALASGRNYADTDGNGVCDNLGTGCAGQGWYYVDADGDGVCDNLGAGCAGQGRYYVDADGDGVCDNLGAGCGWGRGRGGCRN